jgi:hypothetical protein
MAIPALVAKPLLATVFIGDGMPATLASLWKKPKD